jgi:hypothetical protein
MRYSAVELDKSENTATKRHVFEINVALVRFIPIFTDTYINH